MVDHAGAGFELGTDGPTVVLTGVDGSRTSLRAGAYAAGMARRQGARLVVVYVRSGFAAIPFAGLVPDAAASVDAAGREVGEELARLIRDNADRIGVKVKFVVTEGDPFAAITRVAEQVGAELIVVGASESAGHRLVGSLAVRLVRSGRWPVTVVP
jgi:nucleotide-binding universal stress UspA family protein